MPSAKPGPALFLGIELGIDQLRASIVDESLDLVGVECIDFDSDLPEYQYVRFNASWRLLTSYRTQGGIFTTPGEAYTTPVEMWLKGLGEHLCPASICAALGSCTVCPAPGFVCLVRSQWNLRWAWYSLPRIRSRLAPARGTQCPLRAELFLCFWSTMPDMAPVWEPGTGASASRHASCSAQNKSACTVKLIVG